MKKIAQTMMIGVGLTVMTLMSAAAFTPQNEIRQRVLPIVPGDPEVLLHIYTDQDSGTKPAVAPVGAMGSIFELWVDVEGEPLTKVDSKWIGQGGPETTMTVDCKGDVWNTQTTQTVNGRAVAQVNRRTRVDKGYVIAADTTNLSSDPTYPRSLREVMITRSYLNPVGAQDDGDRFTFIQGANYSNYTSMGGDVLTSSASSSGNLEGPTNDGFSGVLSKMARKEMVAVDSFADTVITDTWNLGRTVVTVWPLTTASIKQLGSGGVEEAFTPGQQFADTVRKIIVTWDSIYPGSSIYANIKKVGGAQESILEISRQDAPYDDNEPQEQLTAKQINDATMRPYFNKWGNGMYSIQIVNANLPFTDITDGKEILAEVTFEVKRDISIKGNLGTVGSDDN